MQPLPIDPVLPEIVGALRGERRLVLEAPPGAGKTTRVPRALLDAGMAAAGEILVLEPRRLAARLSARRVAEELGEEVGGTVGYSMRFEDASSPKTRVRFVTEGTLTRRLLRDPKLAGVGTVLLDEFHERHLDGDVALALLRRLQLGARPDLAIAVMSATLDPGPIAEFLGGAPRVRAEGRRFPVEIEHLDKSDDRPLESQVASAVRRLCAEGLDGDVLVFLPGMLEIRRAAEACGAICKQEGLLALPLHGSLSPAEQDRAIRPQSQRKVILATNVAETSVTIDGVVAVVDSGLARVASHSPWSGLPTLKVAKVSRASAEQRAGRAGRTRPGRCLRLYTKGDHAARPEHEAAEVARADLTGASLDLLGAGVTSLGGFPWFEAPPRVGLQAAEGLLARLGATESGSAPGETKLTATGRRMLAFPTHPRLSRLLVEAERRGIAADGAAIAALLGEREITTQRASDAAHRSDVLAALERLDEAEGAGFSFERLRWLGIDATRAAAADKVRKQLVRLCDRRLAPAPGSPKAWEDAALMSILTAYPDRVGRLRRPANATGRSAREVVFAGGGTATLSESSGVAGVDLLVAIDAEERAEPAGPGRPAGRPRAVVRMASAVEADWLLELFTDAVADTTVASWNAGAERVEVVRRLSYDGLVLEESKAAAGDPREIARVLGEAVRQAGWRRFVNDDEIDRFAARVGFVAEHFPELELPSFEEEGIALSLAELCEGATSFADLRAHDLGQTLKSRLSPDQARKLAELAPDAITLPGGRRVKIEYVKGTAPSAGSRLQDFFGMAEGPKVAKGRVPVVLHLLAPNQRAVQITTDLAGFWERHYPAIAKELRRRYPRHAWPDDPRTARPPPPPVRRG